MEMFELRYFLGVAKFENIHRASEKLRVSPASLSKAVARLEDELGAKLFSREGRNIRLTDHGFLLQKRASEILHIEESARLEVSGHKGSIRVILAGAEILLSKMGLSISQGIRKRYPLSTFEYHATDDQSALDQVSRGEAHLAIITAHPPQSLEVKTLGEAAFQTCVGPGHKLYGAAKAKKVVQIEEVLKYPFVSPNHPLLGQVGLRRSVDGWRDDKFPRKVEQITSSLKILEEIVTSGQALAYLPDYFVSKTELEVLKISGCPYSCTQTIKLVARNPKQIGWLNQIF